jgi:hypothetical protein
MENLKNDIFELNSLKKYVKQITHKKGKFTLDINKNELNILIYNFSYYLAFFKMRNIISRELYNNILLVFENLKSNKINQEIITKLEESLSKQEYSRTRNIFETEIFTIKGGKRKTNKRKTNKRKTSKRKSSKKKTCKRKFKKYYGGQGEDDEENECPICRVDLNDDPDNLPVIIHYPIIVNPLTGDKRNMDRPHKAHRRCVKRWAKTPASIKEPEHDVFRFECPQCADLLDPELDPEDLKSIVDNRLRATVNEEIDKLYDEDDEDDEDEPLIRVGFNLNNLQENMLDDLDFINNLLITIGTNEYFLTIVIIGLLFSYILNLQQ